ncbi:DUF6912 family protein [Glycomyces xiaoerkulensis]|uniref:DUF6912 family protein n=1 Tax=Glycomyces xiaoerkulensis TaxID=2038139 RepID=UPI0038CBFBAF
MTRIYVPANLAMLRTLADSGELGPAAPVHMVTAELRAAAPDAGLEDLEYTAFADAALAAVALLVGQVPRRAVVSADVPERLLSEREGTAADLDGVVKLARVAAVHVDDADAAEAIAASDPPDLDEVERHVLDWYAPSELNELLGVLGSSRP